MRQAVIPLVAILLSAPAAIQAQSPKPVFTLPKPTNYDLPIHIQIVIIECIRFMPERAGEWRDEYKNIYEDKDTLRRWLVTVVTARCIAKASMLQPSDYSLEQMRIFKRYQERAEFWE